MAIFDTFAKNVISLLIGVFSCGFLHSANLGQFSFQSLLIRVSGDLYFLFFQPSEVRPKNRPFLKIFPWSPLCYFAKNGHFLHFCEKCYFSPNRSFFMRFFAQRKSRIVQLSIHLIRPSGDLYFLFFQPSKARQKNRPFLKIFPWSPLCYFAKNGHFRHFCEKCYFSSTMSFFIRFFGQHKSRTVQLSIHTNQAIRRLVFPIFLAFQSLTKKSAIFENFPLVPPLLLCQKWPFLTLLGKMLFLFYYVFFHAIFCIAQIQDSLAFNPSNQAIRRLVFPIFLAFQSSTKKSAIFENFPLVPPLLLCQKWPFSTLLRKMLFLFYCLFSYGFLDSTNLGQFSFQSILIRQLGDLYFLFFQPSKV